MNTKNMLLRTHFILYVQISSHLSELILFLVLNPKVNLLSSTKNFFDKKKESLKLWFKYFGEKNV